MRWKCGMEVDEEEGWSALQLRSGEALEQLMKEDVRPCLTAGSVGPRLEYNNRGTNLEHEVQRGHDPPPSLHETAPTVRKLRHCRSSCLHSDCTAASQCARLGPACLTSGSRKEAIVDLLATNGYHHTATCASPASSQSLTESSPHASATAPVMAPLWLPHSVLCPGPASAEKGRRKGRGWGSSTPLLRKDGRFRGDKKYPTSIKKKNVNLIFNHVFSLYTWNRCPM